MKLAYQITGFVGLVFAVVVAVAARDLRLMTRLGPGPGFFPFWLAVLFGGLSLALLIFGGRIATLRDAAGPKEQRESNRVYLGVGAMIAAIALVGLFIEPLGYCLTMFLFCIVTLLLLGERRWYVILLVAVFGSFGVYFFFSRYLGVVLPAGLLSV